MLPKQSAHLFEYLQMMSDDLMNSYTCLSFLAIYTRGYACI